MIPKNCPRLAEVDFPIAAVSRHAVREKSIRHGHPSTLHLWWARRPLASSRAMLLALLLPDPDHPLCPNDFKTAARAALLDWPGRPARWDTELHTGANLRRALLHFIADFANWDNAAHPAYLAAGRALVQAAHPDAAPLVVDPFAGGGSIPLEALRLGCDAFASDLNPVAGLILKTLLEDIPRRGPALADELRTAAAAVKAQAAAELADLYPPDPDGAVPIAYLWARTVRCEAPRCGAEIPLLRSRWLCRKSQRKYALRPEIVTNTDTNTPDAPPQVEFAIFAPAHDHEVGAGTVARARATCLACQSVLPPPRVRAQLAAQRGGADAVFDAHGNRTGGARLTAVVTLKPGAAGRHYRVPTAADYAAVHRAQQQVAQLIADWERSGRQGICPVPDEPLPPIGTLGFRVQRYGMLEWGDLFTARQQAVLLTVANILSDRDSMLGLALGKIARHCNVISKWHTGSETVAGAFAMHTLPMSWDFPEMFPFSEYSGGVANSINDVVEGVSALPPYAAGQVQVADAVRHPLPHESADVWFTDPPYYDAIPYSDLSDFYLAWHKRRRTDNCLLQDPFDPSNLLSPKEREIVQDESRISDGRAKDASWFEEKMAKAFAEGHNALREDGIGSVVFAHKTTEGWEAFLSGMIRGGWTITGSWPVSTERGARLRAHEAAALATSIHLVCRPRPADAAVGDWSAVLDALPLRVAEWMDRLQEEGIKGADLVFACIGPALEIFSRYAAVETPAGAVIGLPAYLEKVWEVVGRAALEQVLGAPEAQARNGAVGALEEDARLTALFLWTVQSSDDFAVTYYAKADASAAGAAAAADADESDGDGASDSDGDSDGNGNGNGNGAAAGRAAGSRGNGGAGRGSRLPYDVARRFAQPLGIHLDDWKSRIIDIDKGVVRLLPVTERAPQLFGAAGAAALADAIATRAARSPQLDLFPESDAAPATAGGSATPPRHRRRPSRQSTTANATTNAAVTNAAANATAAAPPGTPPSATRRHATTLDRVHAAMLYQDTGHSQALRDLIAAEQEQGSDFLRLANALSALYPPHSPEKRLLDAMLLAAPR